MFGRHQDPHSSVYLLADHLDAILAVGEDLPKLQLALTDPANARSSKAGAGHSDALHDFVNAIAVRELEITAHLRQARVQARQLVKADPRFASLIRLFLGGTALISEALDEISHSAQRTFGHDHDPISFLRSRALIGEERAGLEGIDVLSPGEDMAIAGRIELRGLLDLVAAFLDSLDVAYELYPIEKKKPAGKPVVGPARPVASGSAPAKSGGLLDALADMKKDTKK